MILLFVPSGIDSAVTSPGVGSTRIGASVGSGGRGVEGSAGLGVSGAGAGVLSSTAGFGVSAGFSTTFAIGWEARRLNTPSIAVMNSESFVTRSRYAFVSA
jgi:hypothetical protein